MLPSMVDAGLRRRREEEAADRRSEFSWTNPATLPTLSWKGGDGRHQRVALGWGGGVPRCTDVGRLREPQRRGLDLRSPQPRPQVTSL